MPAVSVVAESVAGGVITGPGATKFTLEGKKVSLKGDAVSGHGDSPHNAPVMVQGSSKLFVGGVPVVLAGHSASCGHTANGNPKMTVGS